MSDQSKIAPHPRKTGQPPMEGSAAPAESGAATGGKDGDATVAKGGADDLPTLRARLTEVQRERDHLASIVELLQEIAESLHFVDILQTIARKLGNAFALDRCAIFLTGGGGPHEIRLVASYEDPSIRNLIVDLNRYPELRRALESRETVFIADAVSDASLRAVRKQLESRNVRSIVVLPLQWQTHVIGALFLRTSRDAPPFTDADLGFTQVVASLTAKALRNAHRFESAMRQRLDSTAEQRRVELQRVALIAFLRRLLDRHGKLEGQAWAETLLPKAAGEELERLVTVAMQVFEEEAKG